MRTFVYAAALSCAVGLLPAATPSVFAQDQQVDQQAAEAERIAAAAKVVQNAIDASRANDVERWLSYFAPDAIFEFNGNRVYGREEVRRAQRFAEQTGLAEEIGDLTKLEVLESGWNGQRIYVWQQETYAGGYEVVTYAEYEVRDGKITHIAGQF